MIVITGATDQLGRLVIQSLLERGASPASLVAAVRQPARAADLAALGVQVRQADYEQPETLQTAFAGAEQQTEGNMLFAGEHCSAAYQGYMNGALETGRVAAENLLAMIG